MFDWIKQLEDINSDGPVSINCTKKIEPKKPKALKKNERSPEVVSQLEALQNILRAAGTEGVHRSELREMLKITPARMNTLCVALDKAGLYKSIKTPIKTGKGCYSGYSGNAVKMYYVEKSDT